MKYLKRLSVLDGLFAICQKSKIDFSETHKTYVIGVT